jgi:gp16 family phage-associated protein
MTREEVLASFVAEGRTVTSWAQENGFEPSVVYALLQGRTKGRRGEAHRAAVALGIKRPIALASATGTGGRQ